MANYKFRDYIRGIIQFGDDVLLYELISVILYVGKDTIWNIIISTKLQSKNWNELQHLILEYAENSSNKEALNNILNDIGRHMSFDIAIRMQKNLWWQRASIQDCSLACKIKLYSMR